MRSVIAELSDGELGDALLAGAIGECWSERAAVGLLVAHARWLTRHELRRAIETNVSTDGDVVAWVVWRRVAVADSTASSGDVHLLELACSLAGVPNDRPLSDLLSSLDCTNAARVLNAISVACTGHTLTRRQGLWW